MIFTQYCIHLSGVKRTKSFSLAAKVVSGTVSQRFMTTDSADPPVDAAPLAAVVMKLPPFDVIDPELLFIQCEDQFGIKNIAVDQTKYYYVVAPLDSVVQRRIKPTLIAPPVANKFDNLKQVLLAAYALSDEQKADKLLDANSLGDMKFSDMLACMRGLESSALFKQVWLCPFPQN